jgi:hypothetical protein
MPYDAPVLGNELVTERSLIESSLRQQPGFQKISGLKERSIVHWLAESQTKNWPGGHGPEHYADALVSILTRALALDVNKSQT